MKGKYKMPDKELTAKEQAQKEAAELATQEQVQKEAAELAAKEQVQKEAAELAAKELVQKEAADLAANIIESIDIKPNPAQIVISMRDFGYEFKTAVADLIDNSIDADATDIYVSLHNTMDGQIDFSILDNGDGMDKEGLANALVYGSKAIHSKYNLKALGKFGLGLKTASTAFCKRISLLTKTQDGEYLEAYLDLDEIVKTNAFTASYVRPDKGKVEFFEKFNSKGSGTLLTWNKIDRLDKKHILTDQIPRLRTIVNRRLDELKHHLGLTFQRFMDHGTEWKDVPNIRIYLNEDLIEPYDPFVKTLSTDLIAGDEAKAVDPDKPDEVISFNWKGYSLPVKGELNDEEYKQTKLSNNLQGFYIYRENRCIGLEGYFGEYSLEPHYSNCRLELNFNSGCDVLFDVDVKKSHIKLDQNIIEYIRAKIAPVRKAANDRYNNYARKNLKKKSSGAHDLSNKQIKNNKDKYNLDKSKLFVKSDGSGTLENQFGVTAVKLKKSDNDNPLNNYIRPVEQLDYNRLWELKYLSSGDVDKPSEPIVEINISHDFYKKVYAPHIDNSKVVQSLDYLIWALATAELNTYSDESKENFEELKDHISKNLTRLVSHLPDEN